MVWVNAGYMGMCLNTCMHSCFRLTVLFLERSSFLLFVYRLWCVGAVGQKFINIFFLRQR